MSFTLFDFQEEAAEQLRDAMALWVKTVADRGRPPSTVDGEPIPLLAHLTAITGAGKTPILTRVIGSVGPAIVLWTTNRAVVIDQTVEKLSTVYRHFLPPALTVISEKPTPAQWAALVGDDDGLFIWCLTVASWNIANVGTKGTAEARLNIHRPAPDWAGEQSPWDQLSDLQARKRPLWVVYDEGHGQTDVQLDQLLELRPIGIVAASGTPSFSPKIDALRETLLGSEVWRPMAQAAMVEVPTQAVARAGLLKTTIEMVDLNTDDESKVRAAVEQRQAIEDLAADNAISLNPRAIYITEESDRARGEPRPVVLWNILTGRFAVPASEIAVATATRELPKDAERVNDLSQLRPRHHFLIFNKKFQEGWDDPEAYVAYFDGETKSTQRIKQLIGRVIRQPNVRHFEGLPDLNTAFIFVSAPDAKFAAIVDGIRRHLLEEFGSDDSGEPNVQARTRAERPAPIPIRAGLPDLSLSVLTLVARNLDPLFEPIASAGQRPFPTPALEAPGKATKLSFELTDAEKKITADTVAIGQHIRSLNRDYFLDRVKTLSRQAFERLPDSVVAGPMFEQSGAVLSSAQNELRRLAVAYVADFEDRVSYVQEPDPKHDTWRPRALEPTRPAGVAFARSVHPSYPDAPSFLNNDEKAMCQALDAVGEGWWMRNPPTTGMGGFGMPMPVKVAGSQTFYPDFLWWVDQTCHAIDTTGLHILGPKVRGKLLSITNPRLALVVRGRVGPKLDTLEDESGWTLMLPGAAGPRRLHFDDLGPLLVALRAA
jgi:type III restriction enzyme